MDEIPDSSRIGLDADLDYLRGVKSSTCLLLPTTPSPHPMDFKHPLSDEPSDDGFLGLAEDNTITLQNEGDSSSSGDTNSVVQDPVSAQLINNISMLDYHTLTKTADHMIGQNEIGKLNGELKNLGSKKLPNFVNWNWSIIRKVLLWVVLSSLIACTAAIIAMIVSLPKTCNPDIPWYQGKVFYEIFPASFEDTNEDGFGDLKGIRKRLDYIERLGVSAIRLNYIYEADNYPESYNNTLSMLKIDEHIGTLKDFQDLVKDLHDRNISIILDLPVSSLMKSVAAVSQNHTEQPLLIDNGTTNSEIDPTTVAIRYWSTGQNVDGFYLKELEKYVSEPEFEQSLIFWKHIIGFNKILMASEEAFIASSGTAQNVLLSRIDLIDVHLSFNDDTAALQKRIDEIVFGTLWSKPSYPWVHWNIGNVKDTRVTTKNAFGAISLTFLEFVLPGTVNIFYGDEIGLAGLHETEKDFHEFEKVQSLVPMQWGSDEKKKLKVLPWISNSIVPPRFEYLDILTNLIAVRINTPTIYLKAIYKEGKIFTNTQVRKVQGDLIVIERWYPRRNTCVFVANLGKRPITTDLTSMFYGGSVLASTNTSIVGQNLYFDEITLAPYSAIILKLEK